MSASQLAEYLIIKPDAQETNLHNARYGQPPITTAYGDAWRALRAYNIDIRRDKKALERVKNPLTAKSEDMPLRPSARAEALRCIEAIELFIMAENTFGSRSLPLIAAPKLTKLRIARVDVSVQPDFLVEMKSGNRVRMGAVMLRLAKAPDPSAAKMDATKLARGEHRREMARYMAALMEMALKNHFGPNTAVDRENIFVADIRLGERIDAAGDFAARQKSIEAACRQISRLWDEITPRTAITKKRES